MSTVRFEPIAVEIAKLVSLERLLTPETAATASEATAPETAATAAKTTASETTASETTASETTPAETTAAKTTASETTASETTSRDLPADVRAFLNVYTAAARGAWRLLGAPQFERLSRLHDRLGEEFVPGGPPMSPVYDSYATQHILCEVPQGLANETPYSVLARLTVGQGRFEVVHALAEALAESFLDLYRVVRGEGFGAEVVSVRGGGALSVRLTGPFAQTGDLMLARVLRVGDVSFIADSPYLLKASEQEWLDYFARVAGGEGRAPARDAGRVAANAKLTPKQRARLQQRKAAGRQGAPEAAITKHLKYGRSERFWLDYIMDAYDGERRGIVYLAGVPDRPETLPHRGLRGPN